MTAADGATDTGSWRRSDWIALISVVLSAIAILVTVTPYVYGSITTTRASFDQPVDHSTTTQTTVNVSGSVQNPPDADHDIWLVVRPQDAKVWYPQDSLLLQPGDRWGVPNIPLGEPDHYQLFLFLADSAASSEFHQHQLDHAQEADPPGMAKPPTGAHFLASIDIERVR